jgi:hypothetical protein
MSVFILLTRITKQTTNAKHWHKVVSQRYSFMNYGIKTWTCKLLSNNKQCLKIKIFKKAVQGIINENNTNTMYSAAPAKKEI